MRMASHLILHPAVHTTSRIYITHKFFHRDLHYSLCFHTYGFNVINANGSVKGIGSKNLACLIRKSSKNFIRRTLEIFWVKLNSELANSSLGLLRICHWLYMHVTSQTGSCKCFILTASNQYKPDIRFWLLISNFVYTHT